MSHKVYLVFLVFICLSAAVAIGVGGLGYYATPVVERPFRDDHAVMKPTGTYSHGLGIIGASMISIGVATYSSRKRIRALWSLGRLSGWLEFHIALCLLGPVLVVYHTTFKAGGVAAICLWSMLSVVASGFIGRFLYIQIPRNIKGIELTQAQIQEELERLGTVLSGTELGKHLVREIDGFISSMPKPTTMWEGLTGVFSLYRRRKIVRKFVATMIRRGNLPIREAQKVYFVAIARTVLQQKTIVFGQIGRLFHYWHVIHLPFTVIMFLTLAVHVLVTIMLGYRWIL
ncbi:MAG: hypothetical protein OEM41_04425 [Ignavibacteria bacterium]|nr:hypothetical protein [Ignavibacteria bacterium]